MDRSTGKEDKSFTYDYSFWSAREEDDNYTSQVGRMIYFLLAPIIASLHLRLTISYARCTRLCHFYHWPRCQTAAPICFRIHTCSVPLPFNTAL